MYRYPLGLPHCVCSLAYKPKLYQGKWPITNPAEHHQRCWKGSGDCLGSAGRSESGECSKLRRAPSFEHKVTMFTGNIMIKPCDFGGNYLLNGAHSNTKFCFLFPVGCIWRSPWGMIRGSSRKGTDVAWRSPGRQETWPISECHSCPHPSDVASGKGGPPAEAEYGVSTVWSLNNGKTMSLQSRRRCKGRKHVDTNVNIHLHNADDEAGKVATSLPGLFSHCRNWKNDITWWSTTSSTVWNNKAHIEPSNIEQEDRSPKQLY